MNSLTTQVDIHIRTGRASATIKSLRCSSRVAHGPLSVDFTLEERHKCEQRKVTAGTGSVRTVSHDAV